MPVKQFTQFLLILLSFGLYAQKPTVGLTTYQPGVTDAYTLFAPAASTKVYIIDNCGSVVHSWNTTSLPGQAIAITDSGDLVHTGKINNESFSSGGCLGGRLEILGWDGTLKWRYDYSSPTYTTHHDMCLMPNGNLLVMVWNFKSAEEAIAAGRNPAYVSPKGLWAEELIELKPIGADSAQVVWKWAVWDHLIQDYDSTKQNYGIVANNPDRINLNYDKANTQGWVHINSVDYNAELNQVMVSSRVFGEVWIINHDTGISVNSKSGLVFRYGNPAAYNRGTVADRKFYYQHNAHWVRCGTGYDNAFMVFNNGTFRSTGEYSTVEIWQPELNAVGGYLHAGADIYRCNNLRTYNSNNKYGDFFSHRVSGAQMMANGHLRVCVGADGRFLELDEKENIVWQYVCPISLGGKPVSQGSKPPYVINTVFNTVTVSPGHPALAGKDLSPKGTVETNPWKQACTPHPVMADRLRINQYVGGIFQIDVTYFTSNMRLSVFDVSGRVVAQMPVTNATQQIDLSKLDDAVYMILLTDGLGYTIRNRFVKLTH